MYCDDKKRQNMMCCSPCIRVCHITDLIWVTGQQELWELQAPYNLYV